MSRSETSRGAGVSAPALLPPTPFPKAEASWCLGALSGRLVELSGRGACASLTQAFAIVLDAQRRGEPVAWLTTRESAFFPPDAAAGGVDLQALIVVRLPEAPMIPRAADRLAASGAFGLLVLDLGRAARLPVALQTRLLGMAQKHETAVLCLTRTPGERPSLGSLVSLRVEARRTRTGERPWGSRFECAVRAHKDKRRGPGWVHLEVCRGPDGVY